MTSEVGPSYGNLGALLRTPCPRDGNTGPHNTLPDPAADSDLPAKLVLQCVSCGMEWAVLIDGS